MCHPKGNVRTLSGRQTQQFVDVLCVSEGKRFKDLVADAQELGGELREAFDLTAAAEKD